MSDHSTHVHSDELGPAIGTVSGGLFHLLNPQLDEIKIGDVAHATSNICRFVGHTLYFYSVAQHCVHVSNLVPPEYALAGLLHDAPEAYVGDTSRPLKFLMDDLAPGVLDGVEDKILLLMSKKYKFKYPLPPVIKEMDQVALSTEKRDVMAGSGTFWQSLPDPDPTPIIPLSPSEAKAAFLVRFIELTRGDE